MPLLGALHPLYHGQQLVLAAAQKGTPVNLSTLAGMTVENTSVKQVTSVEMTPRAYFSLCTVSDHIQMNAIFSIKVVAFKKS